MIVKKVFTNNAVSAYAQGQEVILTGKGIGFGKKAGDLIEEEKIEKRFVPSFEMNNLSEQTLMRIPVKYIEISQRIYNMACVSLKDELNRHFVLELADHIYFAVESDAGMHVNEKFLLEQIQAVYGEEYEVARKAVEMIETEFLVHLPTEEYIYIAFHLVNSESIKRIDKPRRLLDFVKVVNDVMMEYFPELQECHESTSYERLMVHLRYLGDRILRKEMFQPYSDVFVQEGFEQNNKYSEFAKTLNEKVLAEFGYNLSTQEEVYLMIHVNRILMEYIDQN